MEHFQYWENNILFILVVCFGCFHRGHKIRTLRIWSIEQSNPYVVTLGDHCDVQVRVLMFMDNADTAKKQTNKKHCLREISSFRDTLPGLALSSLLYLLH